MNADNSVSRLLIMISFSLPMICSCNSKENSEITKVLILSGKNNHEWQKTTPLIFKELEQSGLFETDVTNEPDTLRYESLIKYDVVLSNWNTWPDNDIRMSSQWESDFLRYIREGGGFVSVHAGSSLFYKWEEFHKIGIGRWGKETSHGQVIKGRIGGLDKSHPVTKGIRDFYIADEFWEKTEIHHGAKAIGSAIVSGDSEGHSINEPVLFYDHLNKGRCFFIALGHDERAIKNTGFKTLLLRATQWAAHREISADVPQWLKETPAYSAETLNWRQTDSTVCLRNKSGIVWQFNFNDRYGKPYFHPVATGTSLLTCVSPEDHPWHLGLWFSWKFINGINYWEYTDNQISKTKIYGSEGLTETEKVDIKKNGDFSSDILMDLNYRPAKGTSVLSENRNIHISPPYSDGSYYMDYETVFSTG